MSFDSDLAIEAEELSKCYRLFKKPSDVLNSPCHGNMRNYIKSFGIKWHQYQTQKGQT